MSKFDKLNMLRKNLVEKANEAIELSKLNTNINTEEEGLNDLYRRLGEYCFEKYTNGEISDKTVAEICKDIKVHLENIFYFKEKINQIKNKGDSAKTNEEKQSEENN